MSDSGHEATTATGLPEKGGVFKGEFWMRHGADGVWTVGVAYGNEGRGVGACGANAQEALAFFAQVFIRGLLQPI